MSSALALGPLSKLAAQQIVDRNRQHTIVKHEWQKAPIRGLTMWPPMPSYSTLTNMGAPYHCCWGRASYLQCVNTCQALQWHIVCAHFTRWASTQPPQVTTEACMELCGFLWCRESDFFSCVSWILWPESVQKSLLFWPDVKSSFSVTHCVCSSWASI